MKKIVLTIFLFICLINVSAYNKTKVTLHSCIDGDTAKFKLKKEIVTVRFLAIDTPEIKHNNIKAQPYGEEASSYTCDKLKKANKIELEFEKEKKDKYDRYLAWVFINDNLLQQMIIKKGFAKTAYIYDDYKYVDILKKEENKAKNKQVGIWSKKEKLELNYEFIKKYYLQILIVLLIILLLCLLNNKAKKVVRKTFSKKFKKY